jgi:membrane-bound lytic murein transglycosylase D
MKKILVLLIVSTQLAAGQEETIALDEVLQTAEQWAKENLDEDALRTLESADREKVKQFLNRVQKEFQGEYVVDLAPLREGARLILPLLESHEETLPYASWLKARLDYLEVANDFRFLLPPSKPRPGEPLPIVANPSPEKEREVWIQKYSQRTLPEEAKPYVTVLKPIFQQQRIPPELIWIAEVESSFDPKARSPAGATGLFQLMPATAKRYGLRTWPFDQRLNPEESARTAAQYLNYLGNRFKDWRLALAAYNSGEGRVQRLLNQQKTKTYDSIASRLPAETQLFVPKVEAAILRREGVKVSALALPSE